MFMIEEKKRQKRSDMKGETMRKIIIDTDPGIDDAFAIVATFLSEEVEVLGICSVGGNKGIELTTNNSLALVQWMDVSASVHKGAAFPLNTEGGAAHTPDEIHGANGLGGVHLPFDSSKLSEQSAVDFMIEMAEKYPQELEIFALGPLTNLALAIEKNEAAMKKVKAIYSMGGGVLCGNVTPVAEFNYWFDPESVEKVLELGKDVPFYMLGLNVTNQVIFRHTDAFFLAKEGGERGRVLAEMVKPYLDLYWQEKHLLGCMIHDLTAVLFALYPELSKPEDICRCNVRMATEGISRGQTVVDLVDSWHLEKNAYVVMGIDADAARQRFIDILLPDKAELYHKYGL